ncbi:MAG: hypothetical protein JWM80_3556 [Cyanobacteria bacterium RYN_339]|nr:hypothetical protein [Cyanobacteria bacterium RYN_339]
MSDRDDIRKKPMLLWPIGVTVALMAGLLIGMLVLLPLFGRTEYRVGLYDATHPVAQVKYHNETWAPTGPAQKTPDRQMVAIGHTDEGYYLYVDTLRGQTGGGGGMPETSANETNFNQVFLRTKEGTYVPLARR